MNKTIALIVLVSHLFAVHAFPKEDDLSSFVVVSPRDPRYFELSNGSPYIPIGFNLVGPPREADFDRLFETMAANKINYCRVWVSHQDWNVERQACLQFDEDRAKTIDRLRLYVLRGHKTLLVWCRDSENDWKNELVLGQAPEILSDLDIDLGPYLSDTRKTMARIYDPWKDRWSEAHIESGRVKLAALTRSVVIRVD